MMNHDVHQPVSSGKLTVTHISRKPVDPLEPRVHLKLAAATRTSITDFTDMPVTADGTINPPGTPVMVTLSGCGMDQMKGATPGATGTTWHVDFGNVPDGTYTLKATANGSSASVEIVVGTGKCNAAN